MFATRVMDLLIALLKYAVILLLKYMCGVVV